MQAETPPKPKEPQQVSTESALADSAPRVSGLSFKLNMRSKRNRFDDRLTAVLLCSRQDNTTALFVLPEDDGLPTIYGNIDHIFYNQAIPLYGDVDLRQQLGVHNKRTTTPLLDVLLETKKKAPIQSRVDVVMRLLIDESKNAWDSMINDPNDIDQRTDSISIRSYADTMLKNMSRKRMYDAIRAEAKSMACSVYVRAADSELQKASMHLALTVVRVARLCECEK